MSTITKEQLEEEIGVILNGSDLSEMSFNKVRGELEKTFQCDLSNQWQEIKDIVVDEIMKRESEPESEPEPAPKTTAPAPKRTPARKKKAVRSDSIFDWESEDDQPKTATRAKGRKRFGRWRNTPDSDEDWNKQKKAKKATKHTGKLINSDSTSTYTLSAGLASLIGAESLSRQEVVDRMWEILKERNLFDPNNKQFAICDSDLLKVIGVERFRLFTMTKYLEPHFINLE